MTGPADAAAQLIASGDRRVITAGVCATLLGVGLQRFAYAPLLPAMVQQHWLSAGDAGLLFQCYQRDPRTGFIKLFTKMAQIDMLNQFTTHVGSGLFACPPGVKPGEFIGQRLLG